MTYAVHPKSLTLVNDGQYRWAIATTELAAALVATGYTYEFRQGMHLAVEPATPEDDPGAAYARLCQEAVSDYGTHDGTLPQDLQDQIRSRVNYEPANAGEDFVLYGSIIDEFKGLAG